MSLGQQTETITELSAIPERMNRSMSFAEKAVKFTRSRFASTQRDRVFEQDTLSDSAE